MNLPSRIYKKGHLKVDALPMPEFERPIPSPRVAREAVQDALETFVNERPLPGLLKSHTRFVRGEPQELRVPERPVLHTQEEAEAAFEPDDFQETIVRPDPVSPEVREQIEAELQERFDKELEEARQEAFLLGYESARQELEEKWEPEKDAMLHDLRRLAGAWEQFIKKSEPLLVNLSFDIAQCILDAPLPVNLRSVAGRTIMEAVEQLGGTAPIEIRLHPVDFLRLQESGVVEQLESMNSQIRWEPVAELKQGDWSIQTATAAIRRIEEELFTTLRNRVGLLAAVQNKSKSAPAPDDDHTLSL